VIGKGQECKCVLTIVDFLQQPNLAAAIRFFNAQPQLALGLLLLRPEGCV
jgi:hypothetical protein